MPFRRIPTWLACGATLLASCGTPVYHQEPRTPGWKLVVPPSPPVDPPAGIIHFVNAVGMTMVRVPGGTREVGSAADEPGRGADEKRRTVTLPPFYVSQTEVTQAQFEAVTGYNPSQFRDPDRPVENVQITEAISFCIMLSRLDGRAYRLPEEDVWEFACLSGGGQGEPETAGTSASTSPVQDTPRGPGGIHGMIGNVAEICGTPYLPDPGVPDSEKVRLVRHRGELCIRGGAWDSPRDELRSAFRGHCDPRVADGSIGFRVVFSPEVAR